MKINSQTWEKFQTSAKVEVGMVLNLLSQESLKYLRFSMPCYPCMTIHNVGNGDNKETVLGLGFIFIMFWSQKMLFYCNYIYTMRKMEFKFSQNIKNVHKGTFIVNNNSNVTKHTITKPY